VVHTQLWPVSLKSRIESGIADVLRALADFARASDRTDRRTLAANAQAELGALEDNIALIAYEPPSIQPTRRWLDLRGRIAGLLGRLAPALLIESEQADTTDIARHLSAMAQNEVPRQSMHALPGPVEAIVHDRIRALEIAMKEEALAQS
jgi:multidrug resistance protein MdtO